MSDLPTPLPPPPRRVRATTGSGCAWALAVPFVGIGLGLIASVGVRLGVQRLGTPVTAVVDGTRSSRPSNGRGGQAVRFHYDLGGRRRDGEQPVTADEADRARVGDHVSGRAALLLGWPVCLTEIGSVDRQTVSRAVEAGVWAGLVCPFGLAVSIGPRWRRRRLLETGTAVAGEVTAVHDFRRRGPLVQVDYRFAVEGRAVQGTMRVARATLGGIDAGRPVTVVYDPRRPGRNVAWELAGFALVRPV